jgi:hypothetical protein
MKQGSLTQLIAMQNWWLSKAENPIHYGTFNLDLLLKVVEAKQRCLQ